MKFILGTKCRMTQIFDDNGTVYPVTVIQAGPCPIVRIKDEKSKDGYNAVLVGLSGKKKLGKRAMGQNKEMGNLVYLREFKTVDNHDLAAGDSITVDLFVTGDKVKVVGTSKGKGFQGVVRRHGFHGHPKTHGHKDQLRTSGSVSPGGVQRVFPGIRMPGHMGADRVTVKNLKIVKIDADKNEIYVNGAVPGAKGGFLMISCPGQMKVKKAET